MVGPAISYGSRLALKNKDAIPKILEIQYPLLDQVDIFFLYQGMVVLKARAGDVAKNTHHIIDPIDPALYLPDVVGVIDIYVRIETSSSSQAPLKIHTLEEYSLKEKEDFLATGIYIGILSIMVVYNLIIYLSTKHSSYLLYSGFVSLFLLIQIALSGYGYYYLWEFAPYASDFIIAKGAVLATWLVLGFATTFLQLNKKSRLIRNLTKTLNVLLALVL